MRVPLLLTAILICLVIAVPGAAEPNYQRKDLGDAYTVDWVGNTYGGEHVFQTPRRSERFGPRRVQGYASTMYVAPDGSCYTNATWEERGSHISAYRDGELRNIFDAPHNTGGVAVTADERHVYVAFELTGGNWRPDNRWGLPHRPEAGEIWYAVRRYDRATGKPAGFTNGYGEHGAQLVVSRSEPVTGLAVVGGKLVVGTEKSDALQLFDVDTLAPTKEQSPRGILPLAGVQRLAQGRGNTVWASRQATDTGPTELLRVDITDGSVTHRIEPPEGMIPAGFALDRTAPTERLLVCDLGSDRNIKVFELRGAGFSLVETIGAQGGTKAGRPGLFNDPTVAGPKFRSPLAVGVDDAGNLYVADSPPRGPDFLLRCLGPDLEPRWALAGLMFTDSLATDPANPDLIYSPRFLYRYNRSGDPTVPAAEGARRGAAWPGLDVSGKSGNDHWSLIADTRPAGLYPDQPCASMPLASVRAVEVEGRLLIGLIGGSGKSFAVLRASSEPDVPALVPYAFFGKGDSKLPSDAGFSPAGGWLWVDANRDGKADPEEYQAAPDGKDTWRAGYFLDDNADVYLSGSGGVIRFPAEVDDGLPTWSYDRARFTSRPQPFTTLRRAMYDGEQDAMYLTGYTEDRPNALKQSRLQGYWKKGGKVLARYDHWSDEPTLAWRIDTPWDDEADREAALSLDIAGDYVFLVIGSKSKTDDPLRRPIVFIYDKADGGLVGTMQPKSPVSDRAMVDMAGTLNATRLSDGRYRVHCMDDAYSKGLIYHWKPQSAQRP